GYAYPTNGPSPSRIATRWLRWLSVTFLVAAVASAGVFVYGQAVGGTGDPPTEVPLVPQQAIAKAEQESVTNSCSTITYTASNLIDGNMRPPGGRAMATASASSPTLSSPRPSI